MRTASRAWALSAAGVLFSAVSFPATASADERDGVAVEIAAGTAFSLPLTLTLQQQGFPDVRHDAHYETRRFDGSPYYAWRIGLWRHGRGWELQLVHHKLYLTHPPPEVTLLQVTHGYDMVTLGRAWQRGRALLRAGGGIVLAHPESNIRGKTWPEKGGLSPAFLGLLGEGYFLTGPSLRASIACRIGGRVFLTPELELTAARARIPIVGGEASVPNLAAHLRVSFGGRF